MRDLDLGPTLQDLEHDDWGDPAFPSALAATCHALRRKPLAQFTAADLRVMIGQRIGLPFLVPLALDRLEAEPFLEATFYRGDLLRAVLALGDGFWRDHPEALRRARSVVARADAQLAGLGPVDQEAAAAALAAVPPLLREETIG